MKEDRIITECSPSKFGLDLDNHMEVVKLRCCQVWAGPCSLFKIAIDRNRRIPEAERVCIEFCFNFMAFLRLPSVFEEASLTVKVWLGRVLAKWESEWEVDWSRFSHAFLVSNPHIKPNLKWWFQPAAIKSTCLVDPKALCLPSVKKKKKDNQTRSPKPATVSSIHPVDSELLVDW